MAAIKRSRGSVSQRFSIALAILAWAVVLIGCQAPEEVMQGAEGEYCNGHDGDCRSPLTCEDFVCTGFDDSASGPPCERICDRVDDCDATIGNNCQSACRDATHQWGEEALASFQGCFLDDLSCEELRTADNAPQTCYNQLTLPEERADLCSHFVDEARSCAADSSGIEELRDDCRLMGRTRSEEVWSLTDECVARVADGICDDILDCLNHTFDLSPTL